MQTDEELGKSNIREKPLLLGVNGKYYDVALFAKKHPGGSKVLKDLAGEHVDEYMKGEKRIRGVKHTHSDGAYRMLEGYALDKCPTNTDELLQGPILGKVGQLGERYWTWIHQPYDGVLRLFESDKLELLTRTKWYVVPMIWMPLVLLFTARAFRLVFAHYGFLHGLFVWGILFSFGCLAWTLLEYTLHRFAFHWQPDPKSNGQIVFHFLLHGLHHKTPMDGDRLVFPPAPALIIIGFFYCIYTVILPYEIFCCYGAGKLFGYIVYDVSHYYLHHGQPAPSTGFHYRKVYHHNHHFKDFDVAFGISTVVWDHIFNTVGKGPE